MAEPNIQQIETLINASKIPDTIKQIPTFDGNKKTLTNWLNQVDATLQLYVSIRNSALYRIWMQHIRQKIVGVANEALNSAHVATDWLEIKETLVNYFGDRRELSTLLQTIPSLKQTHKTVDDFYHEYSSLYAVV